MRSKRRRDRSKEIGNEKVKEQKRRWYHEHQAQVRAQQSRYAEERRAWKYKRGSWKRIFGEAESVSIISELELRMPSYRVNGIWEKWNECRGDFMSPKGESMSEERREHDGKHEAERHELHERHRKEHHELLDRHHREHRALEERHRHERRGGHRRSVDEILEDR